MKGQALDARRLGFKFCQHAATATAATATAFATKSLFWITVAAVLVAGQSSGRLYVVIVAGIHPGGRSMKPFPGYT